MNTTKIRLALIGPKTPPNGGMALQTEQLVRLLADHGVDVDFLPTNADYRPRFLGGIPFVRAIVRLLPYLWHVWRLAGRADVIHLMSNSGWSWHLFSSPVLLLAALRRRPVVVNYRGGLADKFLATSSQWVCPVMGLAARVVVPSAYLETVFRAYGIESAVVPNIVDTDLFRPAERSSENGHCLRIAITRNLEPIYGIASAIEAASILRDRGHEVRLLIAGSGPEEARLISQVEHLGLQSRVQFLGRLERQKVARLYQSVDVMLNPTTVDNMPNSLLEALACGVPVVTTDVGGIPYLVKDEFTALMVPSGDANAMAAALLRIAQDAELRNLLITNGLSMVESYKPGAVVPEWLAIYDELIQ